GRLLPSGGGIDDYSRVNALREKANPRIDLVQPSFAVKIVGIFTAVPITGSPRDDLHHGGPLAAQQKTMLVSQPLQPGRGNVVLQWRPRRLRPRSSQRPLFSRLKICHGVQCTRVSRPYRD